MPRMLTRNSGTSIRLSGSASGVTFTNRLVMAGAFTYVGWFKFTPGTATPTQFIIGDTSTDIKIGFNSSNTLSARIIAGGNFLASSVTVPLNTWTLLAFRRTGTNAFEVSVNGSAFATFHASLNTVGNTAISMLGATNVTQNYRGLIDSFRVYANVVLTNTEINRIYTSGIYPSGETVSYEFDDGLSPATDRSGNSNGGILAGATYSDDVPFKPRSMAVGRVVQRDFSSTLRFPGSSSGISATTIPGLNSACTFSAWFNTATITAISRTIVENSINGSNRLAMMMGSGIVRAGYYNGTSYTSKASAVLNPHTWYHGVFTWDGANASLYINAVPQSATTPQPSVSSGGALGIGRRGDAATQAWFGSLAEVCIWNRALSADEVSVLYSAGVIPSSGLVGKYLLNEGSGVTAVDTSGNVNNGTITSGTYTSSAPLKSRTVLGEQNARVLN